MDTQVRRGKHFHYQRPALSNFNRRQTNFYEAVVEKIGDGGEITCITTHALRNDCVRLALGTRSQRLQVWDITLSEDAVTCSPVFSVEIENKVPVALAFNAHLEIYMTGMFDGSLYALLFNGLVAVDTEAYTALISLPIAKP